MTYEDKEKIIISQLRADRDRLLKAIEDIKAEILISSCDSYYMPTKLLSCDDILKIIDKHTADER